MWTTMSKRRALKPSKPLAGDYADEVLPLDDLDDGRVFLDAYVYTKYTLTGAAVPRELYAYLLADKAPRSHCAHCGTIRAALLAYHSDTCSCLCHAVRRRDAAVRAARRVRAV